MQYRIHTTVDITSTGQYRKEVGKEQARLQQQNFDTLINTIGMRSNIEYKFPPKVIVDYPEKYGMVGKTLCNIWIFDWNVELDYVFTDNGDDVAFLKQDFKLVPYIPDLTETIDCTPAMWVPSVNISFEMLK
jgi:hypothetical protein